MTTNAAEIAQLQRQQAIMTSRLQAVPEMLAKEKVDQRHPALQSIKDRLTNLPMNRARLSNAYQSDSEMMRRTNREIAELQSSLERGSPTVAMSSTTELNPVLREFKAGEEQSSVRIAGLTRRNEDLGAATSRIQADLDRVNRGGDAFETLDREYRVAELSFAQYSKKQEDAQISRELDAKDSPNVVVMGAPETPMEPVYPRQLFILMFAIPVSLLLGVALAALKESLGDRLWDERTLATLPGIPLLGSWSLDPAPGTVERAGHVG